MGEDLARLMRMLPRVFVCSMLFLAVLAAVVPVSPIMPSSGLDSSWQFALNQAVAQHLVFGKQSVFTYGPYAALHTRMYHPATDRRMVLGALYAALCYGTALLILGRGTYLRWLIVFAAYLVGGFIPFVDALLLSYPLLVGGVVYRWYCPGNEAGLRRPWHAPVLVVLFSVLGLLPLTKGSHFPIAVAVAFLCCAYLWRCGERLLAIAALASPSVTAVVLWCLAGQPLTALASYVLHMGPIISGYSEAMASTGDSRQILAFLLAGGVIVWAALTIRDATLAARLFLAACFAVFLFQAFKGGFVRHDGHALLAGNAIMLAALLLALIPRVRYAGPVFLLAVLAWALIDQGFMVSSTRSFYKGVTATYKQTVDGVRTRLTQPGELQRQFDERLESAKSSDHIPRMAGTTDIYSSDQFELFVSGNTWNPRPVFQSYSAYTPSLAALNEAHVANPGAPDNIVFRVEPIDRRLPSLEDGPSWPAIRANYSPVNLQDDFLYLKKNPSLATGPLLEPAARLTGQLNETLKLPDSTEPIFAVVELHPTLFGRLVAFVYKPAILRIILELDNGTSRDFRMVSGMGKAGFLLSPLVQNTRDFAMLLEDSSYLSDHRVKAVRITPAASELDTWRPQYEVRLYRWMPQPPKDVHQLVVFDGFSEQLARRAGAAPVVACDGGIDTINGASPVPATVHSAKLLSLDGWQAVAVKDGIVPDEVYVTLTDAQGKSIYLKTHKTPRNDVKQYFHQPDMPDVGYATEADVSTLKGQYTLGLARSYKGVLQQCKAPKVPASIGETSPLGTPAH